MKSNEDREELLSCYVDGELTEQQAGEVRRLAEQDPAVRRRIDELQNLRSLVAGLPRFETAPGLDATLKARLAAGSDDRREGVRSEAAPNAEALRLGRLRAIAAIVMLLLAMTFLIQWAQRPSRPLPSEVAHQGPPETSLSSGQQGWLARLECRTSDHAAVDMIINRAIEMRGLASVVERARDGDQKLYRIRAPRASVSDFLAEVGEAWRTFDQASLHLSIAGTAEPLRVSSISAAQMQRIFAHDNVEQGLALARQIGADNSTESPRNEGPGQALAHRDQEKVVSEVPVPMLTSRDPAPSLSPAAVDARAEVTDLTIVLKPK